MLLLSVVSLALPLSWFFPLHCELLESSVFLAGPQAKSQVLNSFVELTPQCGTIKQ